MRYPILRVFIEKQLARCFLHTCHVKPKQPGDKLKDAKTKRANRQGSVLAAMMNQFARLGDAPDGNKDDPAEIIELKSILRREFKLGDGRRRPGDCVTLLLLRFASDVHFNPFFGKKFNVIRVLCD